MPKIDRTGEINYNNFGSKMIICRYNGVRDIDVYFTEYNWVAKNKRYDHFKEGKIKCPYERRTYGKGYMGVGKYNSRENGKKTKCYDTWSQMMRRCYDNKYKERNPTYKDCTVSEEWYNFQTFAKWYSDNYYTVGDELMSLDKDILVKGNKIYSPETCMIVPQTINTLFIKCDKSRGQYPLGVFIKGSRYEATSNINGKSIHLGYHDTPQEAFQAYKKFKENYIKQVADEYKEYIPQKLYEAMYNYKVEIGD